MPFVVVAMGAVLVGLWGNILCNLNYVRYFAFYFLTTLLIVFAMLYVCVQGCGLAHVCASFCYDVCCTHVPFCYHCCLSAHAAEC